MGPHTDVIESTKLGLSWQPRYGEASYQDVQLCGFAMHTIWVGNVDCHTEDAMLTCTQRASNKSSTGLQGSDAWDLGALGPWGLGALGPWGLETLGPSNVALWPGMLLTQHDRHKIEQMELGALRWWGLGTLGPWGLET